MAFDFKKEQKELYVPGRKPGVVEVPEMRYVAVRGSGDPNQENGPYQQAVGLLYGVAYAVKMSKMGERRISGYFDYVVPPLEGFWWQDEPGALDYGHKENFQWISAIRLPDFVGPDDFAWAVDEASRKKKADFSPVYLMTLTEGLCVQCLHIGSYDDEPATMAVLQDYMDSHQYAADLTEERRHHEIYLSDPRRTAPERRKTVLRVPVVRT